MRRNVISKTYRVSATVHNTLAKAEKIIVMFALTVTAAKLIAAAVMSKSRK